MPFTRDWLQTVPKAPACTSSRTRRARRSTSARRPACAGGSRRTSDASRRCTAASKALAVRAAAVTTIPARSDLEATLLEARLIRERQPAFNVARTTRLPTTIVRAAPDARSPSVRLVVRDRIGRRPLLRPVRERQRRPTRPERRPVGVPRRVRPPPRRRRPAARGRARCLPPALRPEAADPRAAPRADARGGQRRRPGRGRPAPRRAPRRPGAQHPPVRPGRARRGLAPARPGAAVRGRPGRLHLVQDGRLVASADTDTSALPDDPERLLCLIAETFAPFRRR